MAESDTGTQFRTTKWALVLRASEDPAGLNAPAR